MAGARDDPASQFAPGDHPAVVCGTPSHCSAKIEELAGNPVPVMSNGTGFPDASPGTVNDVPLGCVIVPANATPATTSTASAQSAVMTARRLDPRLMGASFMRASAFLLGRTAPPVFLSEIQARLSPNHQSALGVFAARSPGVHPRSARALPTAVHRPPW
jgi:hypothetical protein